MIARHDLALGEIGNADHRTEPDVRVTLQMVDEVLARVVLLRRGPGHYVLESEMAMHVDFRGHDRLAGEVHSRRPGRHLHFTSPADRGELVPLHQEREFSIGALPSPVMSRAPSKAVTPVGCAWPSACGEHADTRNRHTTTSRPRRHSHGSAHGSLQVSYYGAHLCVIVRSTFTPARGPARAGPNVTQVVPSGPELQRPVRLLL